MQHRNDIVLYNVRVISMSDILLTVCDHSGGAPPKIQTKDSDPPQAETLPVLALQNLFLQRVFDFVLERDRYPTGTGAHV